MLAQFLDIYITTMVGLDIFPSVIDFGEATLVPVAPLHAAHVPTSGAVVLPRRVLLRGQGDRDLQAFSLSVPLNLLHRLGCRVATTWHPLIVPKINYIL